MQLGTFTVLIRTVDGWVRSVVQTPTPTVLIYTLDQPGAPPRVDLDDADARPCVRFPPFQRGLFDGFADQEAT